MGIDKERRMLLLMKFGNESHLLRLIKEGMVYLNPLNTFKKIDENKQRFDDLEGTVSNLILTDTVIEISESGQDPWKKLKISSGRINQFMELSNFNSFSLFSFTHDQVLHGKVFKLDQRLKELGSHFVIIRDPLDFLDRIAKALRKRDIEYAMGPVEYLDYSQSHPKITIFNKSSDYTHQQEFRIVTKTNENRPIVLFLGDLAHYAEIYRTEHLELFQIRTPL